MGTNAEELRREIAETRNDLGNTLDAIGDRVSPSRVMERRKNRMTGALRNVRERVMGVGTDTRDAITGSAQSMRDSVTGTADHAMGTVREMPESVRHQAQGSPMAAGAIAFGIGFLAAAAFPASRAERQMASNLTDKIEPLKGEVTNAAREVVDHLKEPAKEAVGAVKDTATDSVHTVQATAKQAASQATAESKQAIES